MAARRTTKKTTEPDQAAAETAPKTVPYVVTARRLNSRKTASKVGQVVDVVDRGTVVQVVETKTVAGAEWAKTDAGVWHLAEHLEQQ